jgi:hypothetical protein
MAGIKASRPLRLKPPYALGNERPVLREGPLNVWAPGRGYQVADEGGAVFQQQAAGAQRMARRMEHAAVQAKVPQTVSILKREVGRRRLRASYELQHRQKEAHQMSPAPGSTETGFAASHRLGIRVMYRNLGTGLSTQRGRAPVVIDVGVRNIDEAKILSTKRLHLAEHFRFFARQPGVHQDHAVGPFDKVGKGHSHGKSVNWGHILSQVFRGS